MLLALSKAPRSKIIREGIQAFWTRGAQISEFGFMLVHLIAPEEFMRQSQGGIGSWGKLQFTTDPLLGQSASWLVVSNEPQQSILSRAPIQHRILFVTEPPSIKKYPARYTNQFGIAVSPPHLRRFKHRHIKAQPCLNWCFGLDGNALGLGAGALSYDVLKPMAFREKTGLISVVCSARQGTEQHNKRLAFVRELKQRLGDKLHWFGKGINPVQDKSSAIAPYKFHIVLENNIIDHFWTEKLADAFLGDSFPIVGGGAGLENYFPPDSFEKLNLDDTEGAITRIVNIMEANFWADRYTAIREARRRLLDEHNIFAVCERLINESEAEAQAASPRAMKVKPIYSPHYRKFRRARKRIRHKLREVFPYGIF